MSRDLSTPWRVRISIKRSVGFVSVGFLLIVPVLASSASASTTTTIPSLSTIISNAKAAMLHQSAVHYVAVVADAKTSSGYSVVADLGAKTSVQTLRDKKAIAYVRLTKTDAYLSGNASGLSEFFGMPTAATSKVGSNWVDIKSGSQQYTSLASSSTIGAVESSLFPTTKNVKISLGKYSGESAYILSWTATVSSTKSALELYVARSGKGLPFYAHGSSTNAVQTISLTHWNEKFSVAKPKQTIPISKV